MSMHFHSMTCIHFIFATTTAMVKHFKTGLQKPVGDITLDASIFTTVYNLKSFFSVWQYRQISLQGPLAQLLWAFPMYYMVVFSKCMLAIVYLKIIVLQQL